MKILLDTHTFLWFIEGDPNLSDIARREIEFEDNQRFLSVASLWEISIKVSIGKLKLGMSFADLVTRQVYGNAIELLDIRAEHLEELAKMPFHHRDPFDRLIIAQSIVEKLLVISRDRAFASYPVLLRW